MDILAALHGRVDRLAPFAGLASDLHELPARAARLGDDAVLDALRVLSALANDAARMQAVLVGVAAQRSQRERGASGLAATQGHASPTSLVQSIMGGTRADAVRQVRIGRSLIDDGAPGDEGAVPPSADATPVWDAPLRHALLAGRITTAQHDAIHTGLGEPIVDGVDDRTAAAAWSAAADQLIGEASDCTVEDLAAHARAVRDVLDPEGAQRRFDDRFERRSLRMWVDAHGQHHARIAFDDEMALWVRSIVSSALRPRRGGPRFMTDAERAKAESLVEDGRSNEQLEYDLIMDVLRAGALASAADVFGARQPGVRMIVVKDAVGPRDALGRLIAVGHAEDGGTALPGAVLDRALCGAGAVEVTVDSCGNPLDVGREQRLFTPRQRIALAVRDGGCLWSGCGQPASYCEAHHIDHYAADLGRTDIDRGVLLCRFHHLLLHNRGFRIRRQGKDAFVLVPPGTHDGLARSGSCDGGLGSGGGGSGGGGSGGGGSGGRGEPVMLRSKAPWRWAWDPPPERVGWRPAAA